MTNWIMWGVQGIVAILLAMNIFWLRRYINKWDKREDEWEKQGGLITRDLYLAWCATNQAKCDIHAVGLWREKLSDEGGVVTNKPHIASCKTAADSIMERINESFVHHRELIVKDIALVLVGTTADRKSIDEIKRATQKNEETLLSVEKRLERVSQKLDIP